MAPKSLAKKDVPWCLLSLVLLTTICHVCVLVGNHETAKGLETIGSSTKGWSGVGLAISHSLQHELDVTMQNMSTNLLEAINHTMHTSELLTTITSLAGIAADHVASSDAAKALTLVQQHMELSGAPLGVLPGLLTTSIDQLLDKLLKKAIEAMDTLLAKLKPVLEEVGKFMIKFGDRIQSVIEGFSITLDNVQKLFDQLMSSASSHGAGEEAMRHETFNLFDVSNTGFVNTQDLKDVATLYDISAFRGEKTVELMDKYDQDHDRRLNQDEFKLFIHDSSLPNSMSVLLRSYAKRLAEVAGNIGAARQRDEIAQRMVDYLQLVCAKNLTKMGAVADALSNGSLSLEFTADVMGELALAVGDPDVLTRADVGAMVIQKMIEMHPENTGKAYQLMANSTFWIAEGFHPAEQPICLKRVAAWISAAGGSHTLLGMSSHHTSMFQTDTNSTLRKPVVLTETDVGALGDLAFKLGEQNMRAHVQSQEALKEQSHALMFQSKSSRLMLAHLLGGSFSSDSTSSEAGRAVKAGMPAQPETIFFAQWLAADTTSTANHFQSMCFDYSKTSSNTLDSFASQILGMVKKIQGFVEMMEKYSTPSAIAQLEHQVHDFAEKAGKDVLKLVRTKMEIFVNRSAPAINKAVQTAVDSAGNNLGHVVADALGTPLGLALAPALESMVKDMMNDTSAAANETSHKVGKQLAELLGKEVSQMSGDALGHELAKLLHNMINTAMTKAGTLLNSSSFDIPGLDLIQEHIANPLPLAHVLASLNEHAAVHLAAAGTATDMDTKVNVALHNTKDALVGAAEAQLSNLNQKSLGKQQGMKESVPLVEEDSDVLSGVWHEVATVLKSMTNVLPQATKTLKFARLEVSKLAANLDSLFAPFETAGPEIFNGFSAHYLKVWTTYFCIVVPVTLALLVYAFWAGGFLGGPGSGDMEKDAPEERAQEGIYGIFQASCYCSKECHDRHLTFWSVLILLEMVLLLVWLAAFVFLALGAVKTFVASGCEQIYILGDETVCGGTLQLIRGFLTTFKADWLLEDLPAKCVNEDLLICKHLSDEMMTSTALTCFFGFFGAIFSFQQLVESSAMHTRAVWRRKAVRHLNNMEDVLSDMKDD